MPAVIRIGFYDYLVKSETQAMAAIKALSEAVLVRLHCSRVHGDCWFPDPDERRCGEITLTIVQPSQMIAREPADGEEPDFVIITPERRKPRGHLRQPRLLLKG